MQPWKGGVLSLDPVVDRLRQLLPATFEELPVPLAVGFVDKTGKHTLVRSGPLPEAVAASAAIPMIFAAVDIPGENIATAQGSTQAIHMLLHKQAYICFTACCCMHCIAISISVFVHP